MVGKEQLSSKFVQGAEPRGSHSHTACANLALISLLGLTLNLNWLAPTTDRSSKSHDSKKSKSRGHFLLPPFRPCHQLSPIMPKEVSDIKQFIEICKRKDASCKSSVSLFSLLPFRPLAGHIVRARPDLFSWSLSLYPARLNIWLTKRGKN